MRSDEQMCSNGAMANHTHLDEFRLLTKTSKLYCDSGKPSKRLLTTWLSRDLRHRAHSTSRVTKGFIHLDSDNT